MPQGSNSDAIAGAAARAAARLDATITDFFLPDEVRLDDRVRLAARAMLHRLVNGMEADLRRHAGRVLAGRGDADGAAAVLAAEETALPLLAEAGLLRDPDLMSELLAQTRADLIADALPIATGEGGRPSLLVRLVDLPDRVIAKAAHAMLVAENERDTSLIGLPAEIQHRLIWWVAAAVRSTLPVEPESDRAIGEAAQRCLAAHDEGERPSAIADRLVAAIDPLLGEVPALVIEALGDRRVTLVVSLLASALGIDDEVARAMLIDPEDDRLWLALRAVGLSREEIAAVALSLGQADPRRDVEALGHRLNDIAAVTPSAARVKLAPLSLPRDLRLAVAALAKARQ